MFWHFKRPKLISVVNLKDQYFSMMDEIDGALGKKISPYKARTKYGDKKLFVLDFNGDIMASQVENLKNEITAIICSINPKTQNRVLIRINSPGGAAHTYGFAASQLERLKKAGIPLIASVDKIAASGGYMMACVADKIIAAPYSIVGSIGVVAELPNFHNFLQQIGVEYKQYTAGKFKRTVSTMGEITKEGEDKFQEDLKTTYDLFCQHVKSHRQGVDIERVATGEHWHGVNSVEVGLVDEILTSEEFILNEIFNGTEVLHVSYVGNRPSFIEKMGVGLLERTISFVWEKVMANWIQKI
jgi:serine protease SohB